MTSRTRKENVGPAFRNCSAYVMDENQHVMKGVAGELVVADDVGDRLGRAQQHVDGDLVGAGVEQAAEDAGEGEHVVDLVRLVAAPGRDDGGVPGGLARVDLGVGIGEGEDDGVGRHRGDVVARQQVGSRHPDEDVGAGEDLAEAAALAGGVGVLGDPLAERVHAVVAAVHSAGAAGGDDVASALAQQEADDRVTGGEAAGHGGRAARRPITAACRGIARILPRTTR